MNMTDKISIQRLSKQKHIPTNKDILNWVTLAADIADIAEITIRIVNKTESARLNQLYRQKSGPTNVLSFDYQQHPLIGDIVLCAPLIHSRQRWAHLIIHGVLHLMGYDHIKSKEAAIMEKQEIILLKQLGFDNPYQDTV